MVSTRFLPIVRDRPNRPDITHAYPRDRDRRRVDSVRSLLIIRDCSDRIHAYPTDRDRDRLRVDSTRSLLIVRDHPDKIHAYSRYRDRLRVDSIRSLLIARNHPNRLQDRTLVYI